MLIKHVGSLKLKIEFRTPLFPKTKVASMVTVDLRRKRDAR